MAEKGGKKTVAVLGFCKPAIKAGRSRMRKKRSDAEAKTLGRKGGKPQCHVRRVQALKSRRADQVS